nr:MAG TPA: hypothetical protein [Caudoviricetes sp.]
MCPTLFMWDWVNPLRQKKNSRLNNLLFLLAPPTGLEPVTS